MIKDNLNIYYSNSISRNKSNNVMQFEELVRIAKSRNFFKYVWKYKGVTFNCPSFTTFPRPFLTAVICRSMTLGKCKWEDTEGNTLNISIITLIRLFSVFLYENLTYKYMLRDVDKEIDILFETEKSNKKFELMERPVYLRCDLAYGYIAGGSIGHIAGVLNNLASFFKQKPLFITTDIIPTVNDDIDFKLIKEKISYGNVRDIAGIAFNKSCYKVLDQNIKNASLLYQRSALNGYAGIKFAMAKGIPFVLEYNGSEVWAAENWGGRILKGYHTSKKIEKLTFQKADLIVCVSSPLKDQLVELGINQNKILVNPNGVNPKMYYPEIDGTAIKERYGIPKDKIVIGFIGTFGAWHGADILATAFVKALKMNQNLHLLLIGDGMKMPEVKSIIKTAGIEKSCTFTGIVPQKDGAEHLACCHILVSPQTRNTDGTPFFGSPTKLFEYMAMGKAIITSDMDQMAEIFENGNTAILCEPGDIEQLAQAICKLAEDEELRYILGKNARNEVCSKYTWQKHTEKIINKLIEILD
jgi:glycosyltransferase involved in cell wall biosynthesis